jgi:hypothetical protein
MRRHPTPACMALAANSSRGCTRMQGCAGYGMCDSGAPHVLRCATVSVSATRSARHSCHATLVSSAAQAWQTEQEHADLETLHERNVLHSMCVLGHSCMRWALTFLPCPSWAWGVPRRLCACSMLQPASVHALAGAVLATGCYAYWRCQHVSTGLAVSTVACFSSLACCPELLEESAASGSAF